MIITFMERKYFKVNQIKMSDKYKEIADCCGIFDILWFPEYNPDDMYYSKGNFSKLEVCNLSCEEIIAQLEDGYKQIRQHRTIFRKHCPKVVNGFRKQLKSYIAFCKRNPYHIIKVIRKKKCPSKNGEKI